MIIKVRMIQGWKLFSGIQDIEHRYISSDNDLGYPADEFYEGRLEETVGSCSVSSSGTSSSGSSVTFSTFSTTSSHKLPIVADTIAIFAKRISGKTLCIKANTEVYLCTDEGKTIERLNG